MKFNRAFSGFVLFSLSSVAALGQRLSTGKASLGDQLDSVRSSLGSGYRFDNHPLSDPAIVVTLAYRGKEEAYLLESFNGKVFYIEHSVFSETGFNQNDSIAALTEKYGAPQQSGDLLFWRPSLDFGHPCIRYGNSLLTWPGGGVSYVTSLNPGGNCQVSAMFTPLRVRAGEFKQQLPGFVFGIDVKLLDPTIALPEFAKLAAEQQRKQQEAVQKARQVKPPI